MTNAGAIQQFVRTKASNSLSAYSGTKTVERFNFHNSDRLHVHVLYLRACDTLMQYKRGYVALNATAHNVLYVLLTLQALKRLLLHSLVGLHPGGQPRLCYIFSCFHRRDLPHPAV